MEHGQNSFELPSPSRTTVYLQDELGSCLPPALVVTVALRPSDPITFLANCLYNYRVLNPLRFTSPVRTHLKEQKNPDKLPFTEDNRAELSTFLKNGDSLNSTDLNFTVHNDVISVCNMIGDIFDDSDIT